MLSSGSIGMGEASQLEEGELTESVPQVLLESAMEGAIIDLTVPDLTGLADVGVASFGMPPRLESIIGTDERRQVKDTEKYPWRISASLLITAADNSQWIGTGWFISPRTLITAGHCVYIKHNDVSSRNGWVKKIQVMPGRSGTKAPFGGISATEFWTVQGWTEKGEENYDYGAIILPAAFPQELGAFSFGVFDDQTLRQATANVAGYPGDRPSGTLWYDNRQVGSVNPNKVFYAADTAGGQSGACVYMIQNGQRIGIAIHAYGGNTSNSGTRISSQVFSNLEFWKQGQPTLFTPSPGSNITSVAALVEVIRQEQESWLAKPGVLHLRPGFDVQNDTVLPAFIEVLTQPGTSPIGIPDAVGHIPVQVKPATAQELIEGFMPLAVWEGGLEEAAPRINYVPPKPSEVALLERDIHNITCHVGPDSGWSVLQPFLEKTQRTLTVAMYDFNAGHIIKTMNDLGKKLQIKLSMILDVDTRDQTMPAPLTSSWGSRLTFVEASVSGPRRIFNNSYHTKVAVRDSRAFWLSSGNWTRTSQPVIEPGSESVLYSKGNREWHLLIDDEPLAQMYEKFIQYDMRMAAEAISPESAPDLPDLLIPESLFEPEAALVQPQPFVARTFAPPGAAPVRVKSLMSPDNYAIEILKLILAAEHSLYLQFSYIRQPSTEIFNDIISAIADKMQAGLDVRVLVGTNQNDAHSTLLTTVRGWKLPMFRKQKSKIHNKGILIDGKITVVGSNNWSSDGTQYNRDTSLVLFSEAIAAYYTEVFLFDWDNLSRPILSNTPELSPVLAPESGPTPTGMVRVSWKTWFND